MINVKKGPAHSLGQADLRGNSVSGVYAGMIAHVDSSGNIVLGGDGTTGLRGLAINNSNDGDVIESGKIALYSLDGASVIETDQIDTGVGGAITAANYPVGTALYASQTTAGLIGKVSTDAGNIIGWVEGVRSLQNATPYPSGVSATQNYTSLTEAANGVASTKSATFKAQVNVPLVSIKLAASN
jgi:hypothetical protein